MKKVTEVKQEASQAVNQAVYSLAKKEVGALVDHIIEEKDIKDRQKR